MTKKADLLWMDMEMTGLDPERDRVLEIALIATDWDFNEIASYESGIAHDAQEIGVLMDMNDFYKKYPENKQAMLKHCETCPPLKVVENQVREFVNKYFDTSVPVLLAGNSIHQDRRFVRAYMPYFEQLLHYRMLDVSAWKIVFEGKFGQKFNKKESHRALDDTRESIAELKYYLEQLKKV